MYNYPYIRPNLLERSLSLLKGIKWSDLLDGTSKTLNVINQAIPIIYRIKPIINNTKTIVKIANSINNIDDIPTTNKSSNNKPIFYI
ncbi:MAG: hypothetical protein IKG58_02425 [Bacilli bacterium]|nr:hypothetical protein [Bacilli bacterium]MBR3049397.1 hypothetical protein [Bacilli bacterium]